MSLARRWVWSYTGLRGPDLLRSSHIRSNVLIVSHSSSSYSSGEARWSCNGQGEIESLTNSAISSKVLDAITTEHSYGTKYSKLKILKSASSWCNHATDVEGFLRLQSSSSVQPGMERELMLSWRGEFS